MNAFARDLALFALVVGAVPLPVSAEVFRCVENGKTIYSDRPCAGSEVRRIEIQQTAPQPTPEEARLQQEANMGRIAVGQTPLQVQMAWGRPTAINTDTYGGRVREQWVYRRDGGDAYVYLEGGLVTSVSTHSETTSAPPVALPPRMPTARERETQERMAKGNERRFLSTAIGATREAVRDRIGEPDGKSFSGGFEYWTYVPVDTDRQTITTVTFGIYGTMVNVDRKVRH